MSDIFDKLMTETNDFYGTVPRFVSHKDDICVYDETGRVIHSITQNTCLNALTIKIILSNFTFTTKG
jgi:hypothetical protein